MHAFLLIGTSNEKIGLKINDLSEKLNAKQVDFPIGKIDDVRNLNSFVRLSFDKPTLIVSKNIDGATEEALNAFLKNLEEPQDNIYFALTSSSTRRVLPTIVSRCEIIKTSIDKSKNDVEDKESESFYKMTTGQKLKYIDTIKNKDKAIELVKNMANFFHNNLQGNVLEYDIAANNIEACLKTYSRLKANGNVNLQLTNFVINLKK